MENKKVVLATLQPYRVQIKGIESEFDLMSAKFGSYGDMNNTWIADDAKGFAKIFGNQTVICHQVNKSLSENGQAIK